MRGGIDTRPLASSIGWIHRVVMRAAESEAYRIEARWRPRIWDPDLEEENEWFRIMQAREWEEWTQNPGFKFFPDSPFF